MTRDDLDLLEQWCDGRLTGPALSAWNQRLATHAELAAEVAGELRLINGMRTVVQRPEQSELARVKARRRTLALLQADDSGAAQNTVATVLAATRPQRGFRWWPVAAIATAAALVAAVVAAWPAPTEGAWAASQRLVRGSMVPADVDSVRFADGSVAQLTATTQVRLVNDTADKALALIAGSLTADVVPQPRDGTFTITTPHGEAAVVGTRFQVALAGDSSVVEVDHGHVVVRSGTDRRDVHAGERVVLGDEAVLALPRWRDQRPLGRLVVSGPHEETVQTITSNTNGWWFDATLQEEALLARSLSEIDGHLATLKTIGAQGVILFGIEGGMHQRSAGFVGDPRRLPDLAPEFVAAADALMARIHAAGVRVGLSVTPWQLVPEATTWRQSPLLLRAAAELDAKISYARQRWNCTLFYVNVRSPGIAPTVRLPASVLRTVAARHPEVLLIIEDADPAQAAVGAAQALGAERVPSGRAVVRLPWFGPAVSPSAALAHGDILGVELSKPDQIEALLRVQERE